MSKKLLYCGLISPLLYLLVDIIGGMITPNYSWTLNAVSELTQAGATNALPFSAVFFLSALCTIAFGTGIFFEGKKTKNKLLIAGSLLLILTGAFTALTGTIFPMDAFGAEMTFPGLMHLVLTAVNVLLAIALVLLLAQGFFKEKNWKNFRIYSLLTLLIMLVFGLMSPSLVAEGSSIIGLVERIVVYSYLLWTAVLAAKLVKHNN